MTDEKLGTSARLRTVVDQESKDGQEPSSFAGVVDDDLDRSVLSWLEEQYTHDWFRSDGRPDELQKDAPRRLVDSDIGKELVSSRQSDAAADATREGNSSRLAYLTGESDPQPSFRTSRQLLQVLRRLRKEGYLGLFCGSTDGGKTNTGLYLSELAMIDDPDLHLATNIKPLDWPDPDLDRRTHFVGSTSSLRDCAESHDQLVVLLDELSTRMNAQTKNYETVDSFYPIITAKSKLSLRIIAIAHRKDGKDVAPSIREHADDFITQNRDRRQGQPDDYSATFYDGRLDDGSLVDPVLELPEIPETAAAYDPDEAAPFQVDG
jgi:hypothetical protein